MMVMAANLPMRKNRRASAATWHVVRIAERCGRWQSLLVALDVAVGANVEISLSSLDSCGVDSSDWFISPIVFFLIFLWLMTRVDRKDCQKEDE